MNICVVNNGNDAATADRMAVLAANAEALYMLRQVLDEVTIIGPGNQGSQICFHQVTLREEYRSVGKDNEQRR